MAFTITEPNVDGIGKQYLLVKDGLVDAARLVGELETATGRVLQGSSQAGHLATGQIAYTSQTIVQIRLKAGEPALTEAEEAAAEAAIVDHTS